MRRIKKEQTEKRQIALRTYIGIDNGVSGSIGIINLDGTSYFTKTPTFIQQDYTKKKKNISRINVYPLRSLFVLDDSCKAIIERPMVNPTRFAATGSALRALEATLIVLEDKKIPYEFIDSKQWQKDMLPKGIKGPELKKASIDIGIRLFPKFRNTIMKQGDADGILIAEWARKKGL